MSWSSGIVRTVAKSGKLWSPLAKHRLHLVLSLLPTAIGPAHRSYRRAVCHLLTRRVLRRIGYYSPIVVYRKDLSRPLEAVQARLPIDVREATELDIQKMIQLRPEPTEA